MEQTPIFNTSAKGSFQQEIPSSVLPQEFLVVSYQSWVIIAIASVIFLGGSFELLVVFVTIPLDIAWRVTIGWYAGNFACKFANFSRCFIYFLSSLVLICMSVDCFCNVFFSRQFSSHNAVKRVRWMVAMSWIVAFVSATPKFYLSYVRAHPVFISFRQCLIENAPPFFSVYPLVESYFAPLIVVLITYTPTFFRVCRQFQRVTSNKEDHRTSRDQDNAQTLKIEGVKLTFAFALIVIVCYTPQILLILLHYICPNLNSSHREEMILYVLESSKSLAIPVAYRVFRSNHGPSLYEMNHLDFY
ncbi:unnamed protein product [Allacma fusca]|uniref:G-protein coupled receptors family 1 profile domain-containing protein n=1 Tax=Allacma fusca TaxID=39272 RepID=A0A8J2NM65_9HEXA|nr:unnamed protein product [Allacma fusca]